MKDNFSRLTEASEQPRERERERESSSLTDHEQSLDTLDNFNNPNNLANPNFPKGWAPLAEEYALTETDRTTGLSDFLYASRELAAEALTDFISNLDGTTPSKLPYLRTVPIGLETDSDTAGFYDPGIYGIVIGRDSEELIDFLDGTDPTRAKRNVARTLAHEMLHLLQTTPSPYLEDSYATVGDAVMGWHGLEEGMAEAIANIALKIKTKGLTLNEAAQDLATAANQHDMHATEIASLLIQKLTPEELAWYLSAANQNVQPGNDKLADLLGEDYPTFLQNMSILLDDEEDNSNLTKDQIATTAQATRTILEKINH